VVRLPGELDADSADEVRAALMAAVDGNPVPVADLSGTAYCSLERLAVLLQARAAVAGVQLRLAAARPAVRQLLERTGVGQALALYPSVDAARDGRVAPPGDVLALITPFLDAC
jgi:anti-anti-sigma factor